MGRMERVYAGFVLLKTRNQLRLIMCTNVGCSPCPLGMEQGEETALSVGHARPVARRR